MIDILKGWININCPECKFTNSVRLGDVSLNKRTICPGCHRYIYLVDKEVSTYRADKRIENEIAQLNKELDKLSKVFKGINLCLN